MFGAQCRALEISEEHNKRTWQHILLVTTFDDAFATILVALNEDNAMKQLKEGLPKKY